jgi:hypothetical protein
MTTNEELTALQNAARRVQNEAQYVAIMARITELQAQEVMNTSPVGPATHEFTALQPASHTFACFDCGKVFVADPADVHTVGLVDGKTGYNEEDEPTSYAPICFDCADACEAEYLLDDHKVNDGFDAYSDEILEQTRGLDY